MLILRSPEIIKLKKEIENTRVHKDYINASYIQALFDLIVLKNRRAGKNWKSIKIVRNDYSERVYVVVTPRLSYYTFKDWLEPDRIAKNKLVIVWKEFWNYHNEGFEII